MANISAYEQLQDELDKALAKLVEVAQEVDGGMLGAGCFVSQARAVLAAKLKVDGAEAILDEEFDVDDYPKTTTTPPPLWTQDGMDYLKKMRDGWSLRRHGLPFADDAETDEDDDAKAVD